MRFVTVRELRSRFAQVERQLSGEGELVITSKGKPVALIMPIREDNLEESLSLWRQARAMAAVHTMQMRSVKLGLDKLSMDEIDAEIAAYRKERGK